MKHHVNGLSHSPQQQSQNIASQQQNKPSQLQNGVRQNIKYGSQSSSNVVIPVTNGRRHIHIDRSNEKVPECNEKSFESMEKVFQMPVFAKPFQVPSHHDQINSKAKLVSISSEKTTTPTDGGKDVESILKMMTSTLEPLTEIAATPRTEIEVHHPNKPHIYPSLPPFIKPPTSNSCKL